MAAQTGDPASLLSRYRALIRARHASPALSRGALEVVEARGPVLAFLRTLAEERVLVAHNLGGEPATASAPVAAHGAEAILALEGAAASADGGAVRVSLPPHSTGIYRLR